MEKQKNMRFWLNLTVDIAMVALTAYGSFQNGWLTLANFVSWLGLIGTIGLAKKWQGNFIFNGIQNASAALIAWRTKLFGDMFMSLFYLGSQFYGFFNWKNNRTDDGELEVQGKTNWLQILMAIIVGFIVLGVISWLMGGEYVFLDSFNNATAIVAQLMQMNRMRSSWILWGLTNVIGIIIWLGVGEPQMAIMYLVFTLNSVRGFINWKANQGQAA